MKKMDFYIGPCVIESADLAKQIAERIVKDLEPFKNEDSGDKISNNTILENAKSEKNTYSQLLAEL